MLKKIFKWTLRSIIVLVLLAVAYFIVMAIRYYGFSDTPATHIPDSADVFIQADSPRDIKDSAIYKLFKQLMKDKVLRANLEKAFSPEFAKGIEDDTIFEQAKDFIEKDIACGVKLTNRNSTESVLAAQIPLRYFIFTPLAGWALRYAGFIKNTEDGVTYFEMQHNKTTIFTVVENRNVLVSTSKELLLEALKSVTNKSDIASVKKGIITILTGDALKYIKEIANQPLLSEFFHDMDIGTLTRATFRAFYDNNNIPIEVTLHAKCMTEKASGTLANLQQFVPTQPLMGYLEKAPAMKNWERVKNSILAGEQSKEEFPKYLYNTFGLMIKDLVKKGIEENLLALCSDTTAFIFDSEEFEFREPNGIWTGNFPVLGFVAPLREEGNAVSVLDEITSTTLKENPGAGEMVTIEYKGQNIRVFQLGVKAIEILKVFDPCYAEVNGYLLFATSQKLILKMIESAHQKRKLNIDTAQNSDILLQTNMRELKSAIEGPLHLIATSKVDTDDNKRVIRNKLEGTYPHQSDEDIERIDKLVIQEVESQKHNEELKQKEAFRWLLYIKNINLNLTKAPDRLDINITLEPFLK